MNQKRSLILPFLALSLITSPSFSQTSDAGEEINLRKIEREGEKAVDDGDWEKAKEVYEKLLKEEPGNSEYNFYMGLAYFQSDVDKEKSTTYFEKVNVGTIPQRDFFYGQALHYDGQYNKAIEKFNTLLPLALDNAKGQAFKADLERFIEQSQNALKHEKNVNNMLRVDNLGDNVNTKGREYAPVVYTDRTAIIFAGTNKGEGAMEDLDDQAEANEDIYFSEYIVMDDAWAKRKGPDGTFMNTGVNSNSNESPVAYNPSKDELIIYRNADLYVSTEKKEPVAQMVDIIDLTADDMTAIYQSTDGTYRFLVTDIFPGKGGLDIFYSKKTGESWGDWLNMEGVNTPYNDDSPFLGPDGNFYFSSQGHDAMGGHDIFKASKTGDSWGNPVNMGMPINSPANDIHFSIADKDGDVFYLASDRKGTIGSFDLFRVWTCYDIQKTTIKGNLLAEGNPLKGATVYLKDTDSNQVEMVKTDADGKYNLTVQPGMSYIIEASANNYLNQAFSFNVPEQCTEYPVYQSLALDIKKNAEGIPTAQTGSMENAFYEVDRYKGDKTPEEFLASLPADHRLKPKKTTSETTIESPVLLAAAQFKDVRFGFDSDEVGGTADAILNNVASYLGKFESVTLVLAGHTDTKGPSWYNKQLSKRRAKSVLKVLEAKGVSADRITVEYYGEEKPITQDFDAEGNYLEQEAEKNRRVEISVVMPEEEQTSEEK